MKSHRRQMNFARPLQNHSAHHPKVPKRPSRLRVKLYFQSQVRERSKLGFSWIPRQNQIRITSNQGQSQPRHLMPRQGVPNQGVPNQVVSVQMQSLVVPRQALVVPKQALQKRRRLVKLQAKRRMVITFEYFTPGFTQIEGCCCSTFSVE